MSVLSSWTVDAVERHRLLLSALRQWDAKRLAAVTRRQTGTTGQPRQVKQTSNNVCEACVNTVKHAVLVCEAFVKNTVLHV